MFGEISNKTYRQSGEIKKKVGVVIPFRVNVHTQYMFVVEKWEGFRSVFSPFELMYTHIIHVLWLKSYDKST